MLLSKYKGGRKSIDSLPLNVICYLKKALKTKINLIFLEYHSGEFMMTLENDGKRFH